MRDMYNPTHHLPPLGRSDNQCLLFEPQQKVKAPVYSKRVRLLTPGNMPRALNRKIVSENWSDVYAAEEIDEKVKVFSSIMLTIMNETVPERTVRMHPSDKPWMMSFTKTKIKARQRAFTQNDHIRYGELCVTVSDLTSKAKSSHYRSKAKVCSEHIFILNSTKKISKNYYTVKIEQNQQWWNNKKSEIPETRKKYPDHWKFTDRIHVKYFILI